MTHCIQRDYTYVILFYFFLTFGMKLTNILLFSRNPLPQLVIRVHMSDESSKTMMVDERQTVRQVLDSLLDKSHCGYSPDWSLVETITELQMGKRGAANSFHHS